MLQDTLIRTYASSTNSGSQHSFLSNQFSPWSCPHQALNMRWRYRTLWLGHVLLQLTLVASIHYTHLPTLPVQDKHVHSQIELLIKRPTSNVRQSEGAQGKLSRTPTPALPLFNLFCFFYFVPLLGGPFLGCAPVDGLLHTLA